MGSRLYSQRKDWTRSLPVALCHIMKLCWNWESVKGGSYAHSVPTHVVKVEPIPDSQLWQIPFTHLVLSVTRLPPHDWGILFTVVMTTDWLIQGMWKREKEVIGCDRVEGTKHSIVYEVHDCFLPTFTVISVKDSLSNDTHCQYLRRVCEIGPCIGKNRAQVTCALYSVCVILLFCVLEIC